MAFTRPYEVMNVVSTGQESLASLARHLGATHAPTTRIGGRGHFRSKDLKAATTCSSSCSATVRGSSTTRSSSIRAITGRLARLSAAANSSGPCDGAMARARDGKVWPGRLPPPIAERTSITCPVPTAACQLRARSSMSDNGIEIACQMGSSFSAFPRM